MTTESDVVPFADIVTDNDGSAHTSARMSGPSRRIEVITGPDRRRRWSLEQKRAIVAESLRAGASPSAVARRHGLNTGQIYTWRRLLRDASPSGFARVDLAEVPRPVAPLSMASASSPGLIEIALPDGACVRVDAKVDERSLRRVLRVLRDR
jgi:transposase-like protein